MPPALGLDPLDLLGSWELERLIVEHVADERSQVTGTAELTLHDDGRIRWAESGTMSRHGTEIPVRRVLYVEQRDDGWFVTFEDGRDFHPWEPGQQVEHLCSADLYVGLVERVGDDRWSVRWRVTGPSKDYTMTSMLTR